MKALPQAIELIEDLIQAVETLQGLCNGSTIQAEVAANAAQHFIDSMDSDGALVEIEAEIRDISTDIWTHTVDDPETATVTSEAEGMTPERYERSKITARLTTLADKVERLINNEPLVIDGVEITDPTMSPCGRFPVKNDGGGQ